MSAYVCPSSPLSVQRNSTFGCCQDACCQVGRVVKTSTLPLLILAWAYFLGTNLVKAEPVWLPSPGLYEIQQDPPSPPDRAPDLILEPGQVFELPAQGSGLIRSFVIPASQLESPRHLQALELLPGSGDVVKHAVIRLDLTSASQKLDQSDKIPGFPWRPELASLRQPEALFTVWTPRISVSQAPLGTGWRVHPDADFVVTLHLKPNGTATEIKPMIACWFASQPIHHVLALRMANETIEIKEGAPEYSIRDSFTVPVDTQLHGVYPVANERAESVRLDIFRPSSQGERIFEIRDWQSNAQEDYKFKEPLDLPAGTRLEMKFVYSNLPGTGKIPQRVIWGPKLENEVGELYLQLVVDQEQKAVNLAHSINRHQLSLAIERAERRFEGDAEAHAELAILYTDFGNHQTAVAHGQRAVDLAPDSSQAHAALGAAYLAQEFQFSAEEHLTKATEIDPSDAQSWFNLGNVFLGYKVAERAVDCYKKAAKLSPRDARIANNLGTALLTLDNAKEAKPYFEEVVERYPRHSLATANLARTFDLLGEKDEAVRLYKRAILLAPGMAPTLEPLLAQLESKP